MPCGGKWKAERFASNMHTWIQLACNMTFFGVVVSASLEKYEQLLPFYYLCVCKSDSFIRLHFSYFCSLNAQIQTQIEIVKKKCISQHPFPYASLGALKRIFYYAFSSTFSIFWINLSFHVLNLNVINECIQLYVRMAFLLEEKKILSPFEVD